MSLTGTFILPSPQKRLAAYLSTPISTHPENRKQNKQNGFSKFSICSHKKSPWTSRKTNKKAKQGLFVCKSMDVANHCFFSAKFFSGSP